MKNYNISVVEYLREKGLTIVKDEDKELVLHCIFSECDKDSKGTEAHLYINKDNGKYQCKKCGEKGNIVTLKKHFGDTTPATSQDTGKKYFTQSLVDDCAKNIPERIKKYLNERGVSDEIILKQKIGFGFFYGSWWITIPIKKNDDIEYSFFILRKDPESTNKEIPKNLFFPKGKSETTLYGYYASESEDLIITEGILDCLALLSEGIKAVCSTGGCMTFKEEWVDDELLKAKSIYIAYDHDEVGEKGADKVLKLLKQTKHKSLYKVALPDVVGDKGDVNDYLTKHKLPVAELFTTYAELYPKQIDTKQFKEMGLNDLEEILALTIKGDRESKLITFLCQLSAFTKDSQFNIMFNSPSSTGKSFTALEVSNLFPRDSLLKLGNCSATAFFHDSGKYNKETNTITVDLSNKILIFTENQHYQLLEKLRSFLSHDEKIINIKITDKGQKGGNKTKNIELVGYTAVVFCTAFLKSDAQEKTRFIILSPEITDEKILAGIKRVVQKEKGSDKYFQELENNPERKNLKLRIEAIRNAEIENIYISNDDSVYLEKKFFEMVGTLQPRHQRDMQRIACLAKSTALLNLWFRNLEGQNITLSRSDIDIAFMLYKKIAITQSLGISPYLYQLYEEVIKPCYLQKVKDNFGMEIDGIKYQDILNYHFKVKNSKLDYNYLRLQVISEYEACGLIERVQEGNKTCFRVTDCVSDDQDGTSEVEGGVKIK
jgi:DNA primase